MKSISRPGGRIFYTESGAGNPPIVFVHGYGCAHEDWEHQVAHFALSHRVLALDQRGHGQSASFSAGFDIEHLGADLAALLAPLPPAVLVGHSLGCRVVLETRRVAPERVAGLALGPEAGTELFAALMGWDGEQSVGALTGIEVPLLVVQSTYVNDRRERVSLCPGETTPWLELVRERAPDATVEILDGLGHFNMSEAPERFNRCLAGWLDCLHD